MTTGKDYVHAGHDVYLMQRLFHSIWNAYKVHFVCII